jgi:hypothetical protein
VGFQPTGHQLADQQERWKMLWTIALVLVAIWMLGLMTANTMGGFIHLLLAVAVIAVLLRVISGRRAV